MTIITSGRVVIDATTAVAWAILADYTNDPRWRHGVERMEQTPPGEVFDHAPVVEELRILGRLVRTPIEVHAVRPGSSFAWRATDGTDTHGTRSIVALDDGRCELHTWRRIALTGADRLLQPVVSLIMSRNERRDLQRAAALVAEAMRDDA